MSIEILIRSHRDSNQLDFQEIWKSGIFIFDSNVLLDLYRLPKTASEDLLNILKSKKFNDRVWIGFQVILEFLSNRHEAISDQKNKFTSVRSLIDNSLEQYEKIISHLSIELANLKLKQRHSLIDPDNFINEKKIAEGSKYLVEFLEHLEELEKRQLDVNDADKLKDLVIEIFNNKIGKGFDKQTLLNIYKEGEIRYASKIPPGYKDNKKEGAHIVEDKEYVRKYGDLIFWKEILEKVKKDNLKHVVVVTGDVKEDWWNEKRGKKIGPRIELINEIYFNAPSLISFYMYDTPTFLKYAKNQLNIDVKDSSIDEAQDLIEFSRQSRQEKEEGVAVFMKTLARQFNIKVGLGNSIKRLPLLNINTPPVQFAVMEIFSNVEKHSRDRYVGIQGRLLHDFLMIRFKNYKSAKNHEKENSTNIEGKGLEYVRSMLSENGIDFRTGEDERLFWVEIFIPIVFSF